jgi:glycine oxidase
LAHYPKWEQLLGDIGLRREGTLEVALGPDDLPYLRRQLEFQQLAGLNLQWLGGSQLRELEPALAPNLPAGILAPDDWQLDNRLLILRLIVVCQALGVSIHTHQAVTRVEANDTGVTAHTALQAWTARQAVACTGIAAIAGVPLPAPIQAVKGQMMALATVPQLSPLGTQPTLGRVVRIRSRQWGPAYLVPKADRLLLGSTAEEVGQHQPLPTAGGLLDLLRKAYTAVPALYDHPVLDTWTGLRPSTPERTPILGRVAGTQLYFANGLFRHGILLAPLISQAILCLLNGISPPKEVAGFVRGC